MMKRMLIGCAVSLVCGTACADSRIAAERVDAAAVISWVGSASVRIVSLFGETRTATLEADGIFPVQFGASPVYLVAERPVEAVRIDERNEK